MLKRLSIMLACAASAACVSAPDDYPSLAVRDAERVTGTFAPGAPALWSPAPVSETTLGDLERLIGEAAAAHGSYRGKLERVQQAVSGARGAEPGSDGWSIANIAIAELESDRSQTMIALAEIDRLYVTAATDGHALDELAAAQALVSGIVAEETSGIDELFATLR